MSLNYFKNSAVKLVKVIMFSIRRKNVGLVHKFKFTNIFVQVWTRIY